MLGTQCLDPPEYFIFTISNSISDSSPDIVSPCPSPWRQEWKSWRDLPSLDQLNAPQLPEDFLITKMATMTMVMLTWERNLLTLLLGGCATLPGRFLPRSWNLSVIFLWGWADSLNVMWMWKMIRRHLILKIRKRTTKDCGLKMQNISNKQ